LELNCAIGMYCQVAVARMTCTAPGMYREAESPSDHPGTLTARMPVLLPVDQLRSLHELVAVDVGSSPGKLDVLEREIERIHLEGRCKILQSSHRNQAGLRMVGRAPCPSVACVGRNTVVFDGAVGDRPDIRERYHAGPADASGTPGPGLPGGNGSVL